MRFSRKPIGAHEVYDPDDASPLDSKTWELECQLIEDEFVWFVRERDARYRAAQLAEEIAIELAQFHIDYEKAYGRTV